jgi:hypothetical protein
MRRDNRLAKRGQKKATPWMPANSKPAYSGWYDLCFANRHKVRLYWCGNGDTWLLEPGERFDHVKELRRGAFTWRGIDSHYYSRELGPQLRRLTAKKQP